MSRAVNGVVIGIAAFILLAGSFWYVSVAQGNEKLAVDAELTFQSADASNTRLLAELTFRNRHDVDVQLHDFWYGFRVDDLSLAKNHTDETLDLGPRSEHHESIVVAFPTDFVSEWLKNHVEAGEESTAVFYGNATFQVGSRNQTIEFEEASPFTTDVRASLEDVENCPRPSPQPCVQSASATWRERENTRVLDLTLQVKNGVEEDVKIDRPNATLLWGGVPVSRAEAAGALLPGGGSQDLQFALFLEHEKLKQWWPKHLEACEKSPVSLSVSFTYQVHPEDEETTSPSPTTVSSPNTTSPSPTPTSSSPTSPSSSPTTSSAASPTNSSSAAPNSTTTATVPTPTNTTGLAAASYRSTYVFVLGVDQEQTTSPDARNATWDLEAKDLRTNFVCDDPDTLLDLP